LIAAVAIERYRRLITMMLVATDFARDCEVSKVVKTKDEDRRPDAFR
jgi:hypothetical protein